MAHTQTDTDKQKPTNSKTQRGGQTANRNDRKPETHTLRRRNSQRDT